MLSVHPQSGVYTRISVRSRLSAFVHRAVCVLFATALLLVEGGKAQDIDDATKRRIDELIEQLQSSDVAARTYAVTALVRMGPAAKDAVPALIAALKDQDADVRGYAFEGLKLIVPWSTNALPLLIAALKDQNADVRRSAAKVLGEIGPEAKEAVPALTAALKDQDGIVRFYSSQTLGRIATALFDSKSLEALPQLRKTYEEMKDHPDSYVKNNAEIVKRMIVALEAISPSPLASIRSWIINYPYWVAIITIYLFLLVAWLMLIVLRPLWLLRLSEFFRWNVKLKPLGVEFDFPSRHLLLISFFHYRTRVLDAWVRHHLPISKENFAKKHTVAQRNVYVVLPALIEEQMRDSISAAALQPIFGQKKVTLLIAGEGGAGKTSLACQMAMWAMADEPAYRLCKTHQMLPVLIEANLEPRIDNKDVLVEAVRGSLREVIGESEPIFEELMLHLLRKRRVLVIVDSLSELDEATRKSVRPASADFPVAALVITSRIDEALGGASKTLLRPLRLKSNRLSEFMDGYLKQLSKRDLFDDEEYFDACRRLSQLVGDREITVLIAKMYAEQMIAAKEKDTGAQPSEHELPRNLPDLMLGYVKRLNDQVKAARQDIRKVVNVAKIAAWECLKQTCRPTTAKRDDVLKALNKEPDAEILLKYLEDRLQLIQTTGPISDLIRFSLDPLAEYLAALYLVERCGKFEDVWQEFFENAEKQQGAPEAVKGFLLAVRDCCVEKGDAYSVPEWVSDRLARLAGLNPETMNMARLKQRVDRLAQNLKLPDAEDRVTAAEKLGEIGPDAYGAVSALLVALTDRDESVREATEFALDEIVYETQEAVPALIAALKSQDERVRRYVTRALGLVGPKAKDAAPALLAALKDQDEEVRDNAEETLEGLILGEAEVIPALIAALKDEDQRVRRYAAYAIGESGPDAKEAVPALSSALQDQDKEVRRYAAETLRQIGPGAREAVLDLIAALQDQDKEVRRSAVNALWQVGPDAKEVVPALIAALKDQEEDIRSSAAFALLQIGSDAKEALAALIATINDQDSAVHNSATEDLGNADPAASSTDL